MNRFKEIMRTALDSVSIRIARKDKRTRSSKSPSLLNYGSLINNTDSEDTTSSSLTHSTNHPDRKFSMTPQDTPENIGKNEMLMSPLAICGVVSSAFSNGCIMTTLFLLTL